MLETQFLILPTGQYTHKGNYSIELSVTNKEALHTLEVYGVAPNPVQGTEKTFLKEVFQTHSPGLHD